MARPGSFAADAAPAPHPGRLLVVATPIGNLGDIAPRAAQALAEADLIAAEDTRHTGKLLAALGIRARLRSLHDFNEAGRVGALLQELASGRTIVLVSDAGTPLLSDPGFALVRAAAEAGVAVSVVPGPSALTAALSLAGLPTDRFVFEGFLPARAAARRSALAQLASEARTLVFFEAPHRLAPTLADMAVIFGGDRRAVVARELTKVHESVYRGTLEQLARTAGADETMQRGELTLVVAGAAPAASGAGAGAGVDGAVSLARVLEPLLGELPPGRAAALAARITGVPRAEAYALARRLRPHDG